MGVAAMYGRTLRANLCEIEHGVFYATYPESNPGTEELPSYLIGASAADVKAGIESSASALGYGTIIWTQTIVAPRFAPPSKTVILEPATTYAAQIGA
jgi:hypothetical protein